jgi:hypothetical protein
LAYIPPQGLKKSWFGIYPPQGVKLRIPIIPPPPPPPPPMEEEPLGEFLVYPFAQSTVLTEDPLIGYSSEATVTETDYTEKFSWTLDKVVNILSVFANFAWAMISDDGQAIYAKWQVSDGAGGWIDVTDEHSETSTSYALHSRSGVISKITGFPSTSPITIRLVAKKGTGTGGKIKVASTTYFRITYKT